MQEAIMVRKPPSEDPKVNAKRAKDNVKQDKQRLMKTYGVAMWPLVHALIHELWKYSPYSELWGVTKHFIPSELPKDVDRLKQGIDIGQEFQDRVKGTSQYPLPEHRYNIDVETLGEAETRIQAQITALEYHLKQIQDLKKAREMVEQYNLPPALPEGLIVIQHDLSMPPIPPITSMDAHAYPSVYQGRGIPPPF